MVLIQNNVVGEPRIENEYSKEKWQKETGSERLPNSKNRGIKKKLLKIS